MISLRHWRACEQVSVIQAVLLIVGANPAEWQDRVEQLPQTERPLGFDAVVQAMTADILLGVIRPHKYVQGVTPHVEAADDGISQVIVREPFVHRHRTLLKMVDVEQWVRRKGIETEFFANAVSPAYLDPSHPQFSYKLAAAIHAWNAIVGNPKLQKGLSAKAALKKWLKENAKSLELGKSTNLSSKGIEDVAKVANWATKGGAPKTP
jgi:hypothetical protein